MGNAQARSLSETVRLDARTKLLNPKFYEGMLSSGYEGAREITKRLRNTMGWSATSGDVDNFVYEDANDVFIADPEMQKRLLETNPNAFRDMITTFLEANGRGYWDTPELRAEAPSCRPGEQRGCHGGARRPARGEGKSL